MDDERKRRSRVGSFVIGGVVGTAGTIATVRRLRRSRGVRLAAGLAAFEDAPCFLETHGRHTEAGERAR